MKKFILFILFTVSIYSQDYILLMDSSPYYSYVAINVGATVSEDQIIFSGASTRSKTTKALGTTRAVTRYMRWYPDSASTELISNGTFDTDLSGWDTSGTPTTYEQVASGGGFTNTAHIVTDSNLDGIEQTSTQTRLFRNYRLTMDINVTAINGTIIRYITVPPMLANELEITATGVYSIDTVLSATIGGLLLIDIDISQFGAGSSTFYLDNVSVTPTTDSVSGYSKVLNDVIEDIPYYYSQSVSYTTKTGTSVWDADDVDTCYSLPNSVNFQWVTNGGLDWLDESSSETGFQIVVDTMGGTSWDKYDSTTAANITGLNITGLYPSGYYKVKIRTIGNYANSDYSPVWFFTSPADLSDTTAPSAPTNIDAINLTKLTPPAPADTIPIFTPTSFTNLTNIGLDSLCTSNGMALSGFDSCYAYAAGDSFRVGIYGDTVTAYTRVHLNDTLYAIKSSSGSYSSTNTCSLTVGGVLKIFSVTTASEAWGGTLWYVDKSIGDDVGANVVTNGSFSDETGWTLTGGATISGGVCTLPAGSYAYQLNKLSIGTYYKVKFTISGVVEGSQYVIFVMGQDANTSTYYRNGDVTVIKKAELNYGDNVIRFGASIGSAIIDNVSVEPLNSNHTGRDWDNAFYSLEYVNYADSVSGGDSIYVSGGADSLIYSPQQDYTGMIIDGDGVSYSDTVVIAPSWESGHNGSVYIMNSDTNIVTNLTITEISSIKLTNLNIITSCTGDMSYEYGGFLGGGLNLSLLGDSLNIIDSCVIRNDSTGAALGIGAGSYRYTISNSTIENIPNATGKDIDILTMNSSRGGHRFIGNTIAQKCSVDNTTNHPDFIQIGGSLGDATGDLKETVFINNFMYQLTPTMLAAYNAGIYISSGEYLQRQKFTFINNIMVMQLPALNILGVRHAVPAIWLRGDSGSPIAVYTAQFYNNTIIYPSVSIFANPRGDTLIAKNNFFVQYNDIDPNAVFDVQSGTLDTVISDYNIYSVNDWSATKTFRGLGDWYEFAEWQALGYDVNSDSTSTNPFSFSDDMNDYMTPAAYRGAGTDLSSLATQYPEIEYDILGNPRGESWDIGALQYTGGGMSQPVWKRLQDLMEHWK